jgi:uncharacterized protein DUF6929
MNDKPPTRGRLSARFDAASTATLDRLVALEYELRAADLPPHVRAASALRRFAGRLVIVQDDVDALAVLEADGTVRPVLLPPRIAGERVFDNVQGNKRSKLDLEACVTLADGRLVAFGSGAKPVRERLVTWRPGTAPVTMEATAWYREVRTAVTRNELRLNIEGVVILGSRVLLFHRGNDSRRGTATPMNTIAELDLEPFERWLDGAAPVPPITKVTDVDLGAVGDVPFGFTDAVALDAERVVVLACAEDSSSALTDGAVLGARVGLLDRHGVRLVDVHDVRGAGMHLKLEGIERRPGTDCEFDVVADVDSPLVPAQLGRLVWDWR